MAPISLTLCSKPDLLHTDDDLEVLRALSRQLVLSYVLKSQNETPNNAFTVADLAAGCAELRLFLSWASDRDNAGPVPVSPDHHQFERPLLSAASSHATLVDTPPLRAGREKRQSKAAPPAPKAPALPKPVPTQKALQASLLFRAPKHQSKRSRKSK